MATANQSLRPLAICSRCLRHQNTFNLTLRTFSTSSISRAELQTQSGTKGALSPLVPTDQLDPEKVGSVSEEQRLIKFRKLTPVGSRRRRAALASLKEQVPFEQLPYQCFQEARKILLEDREQKVADVEKMRKRIATVMEQDPSVSGGVEAKETRLRSMRTDLEKLKILADINDPMVKKRFEDGQGDMNKPIYRYLADRKWREMKRKILVQRVTQMNVIPDVLPSIDPILDIDMVWNQRVVPPGEYVSSSWSEKPPKLRIQKFDRGGALYTIVAVDSDVPNLQTDNFEQRCHGIWANISIAPDRTDCRLPTKGTEGSMSTIVPWSPPYAQKGSPYHRISFFVFEQPNGKQVSVEEGLQFIKEEKKFMDKFSLRAFAAKSKLSAVGATMFRCKWDETTAEVMKRSGIPGADVEFKRQPAEALPEKYRRKDGLRYRGWKK